MEKIIKTPEGVYSVTVEVTENPVKGVPPFLDSLRVQKIKGEDFPAERLENLLSYMLRQTVSLRLLPEKTPEAKLGFKTRNGQSGCRDYRLFWVDSLGVEHSHKSGHVSMAGKIDTDRWGWVSKGGLTPEQIVSILWGMEYRNLYLHKEGHDFPSLRYDFSFDPGEETGISEVVPVEAPKENFWEAYFQDRE